MKPIDWMATDRGPTRFWREVGGRDMVNHWDISIWVTREFLSASTLVQATTNGFRFTVGNGQADYRIVQQHVDAAYYELELVEGWIKG